MAWTAVKTWAVGDVLTAADMNTYVRDNADFLHSPPAAGASTPTQQSVANNSNTDILFTTEDFDTDGLITISGTASKFTVQHAGIYVVTIYAVWEANSTGRRIIRIMKNTNAVAGDLRPSSSSSDPMEQTVSAIVSLAAADEVKGVANQTSGASLHLNSVRMALAWVGTE